MSHLPVIVDPSHAAGVRSLVPILSRAAAVVGADGLFVEVHPMPEKAMSDGNQSLTFDAFRNMMDDLQPYLDLQRESRTLRPQLLAAGGAGPVLRRLPGLDARVTRPSPAVPAVDSGPTNVAVLYTVAKTYEPLAWLQGGERFPSGASVMIGGEKGRRPLFPTLPHPLMRPFPSTVKEC